MPLKHSNQYFILNLLNILLLSEEIKASRKYTTGNILSFILQDKFLDLSSTKKQVFQKSLVFSFAKSYLGE